VFIDETWTRTNMTPLRGWAPRGQRLQTKAPQGHWKTTTFLAALRHRRIDAPWLFDGPIDGESFRTYVEKVLVPTLHPGDIVIMDNLGGHKAKAVRQLIRAAGAKLFFLPKYSPDRNPIEQGLRQDQALLAQGRRALRRSHLCRYRRNSRSIYTRQMRQLFSEFRLCPNLKASRSKLASAAFPGEKLTAPCELARKYAANARSR
jgi:transposase